jgi:phage terminase large subunit-like protein
VNLRSQIAHARRELAKQTSSLARGLDLGRGAAWLAMARPEQLLPPVPWRTWFIRAGRGWGKTRTGAEAVASLVRAGLARRIAVVARTEDDLRNVAIAALQEAYGPGLRYFPSTRRLVFANGAIGFGFTAGQPDSPRGYEFDLVWFDELAAFPDPAIYDQFQFALRVPGARQIVTTTPRPTPLIRTLLADPTTFVTTGRTSDNAMNLDRGSLISYGQYQGTRLARQELEGEVLEDLEGGLWDPAWIEPYRIADVPGLVKVVVAIDPALGGGRGSDETGIIVAGKSAAGHGYVLADLSGRMSTDRWAHLVVGARRQWGAERIVAEENVGGSLVRGAIQAVDPTVSYRGVRASLSKLLRAAPIAALYEQGRIHHIGTYQALEDQLCTARLEPGSGPNDRLDALVWAFIDLDLTGSPLDVPGGILHDWGVWKCSCDNTFQWRPGRLCPRCGLRAPMTYDDPVAADEE